MKGTVKYIEWTFKMNVKIILLVHRYIHIYVCAHIHTYMCAKQERMEEKTYKFIIDAWAAK